MTSNKLKKHILFILIWVLMINNLPNVFSQDAGNFNVMRIENEDKLVVPREKTEEVWNYLIDRYVNDKKYLKSLDPKLDSYWYDEYFIGVYFDTPKLQMLNKESGIRHRKRWNLSDPSHKKSGRELMQIKINHIDNNAFNRGEIKFKIEYPKTHKDFVVYDASPVLGIIKEEQRENFKQRMSELDIDPYSLRKILTNEQRRRSLYISRDGEQFISIRLDECSSKMLWVKWQHTELEPELNEIPYTEGTPAERKYMEDINKKIVDDILEKFPEIKRDLTPKYNKAFNYFEKKIPFLRYLIRLNII